MSCQPRSQDYAYRDSDLRSDRISVSSRGNEVDVLSNVFN